MNSADKSTEKKKKALIVLLVLFLCFLLGVGIRALIIRRGGEQPKTVAAVSSDTSKPVSSVTLEDNGSAANGMARSKSSAEVLAELKKSEVYVTDKLSSNAVFPSGQSGTAGRWMVENVQSNHVIIQCEVYLGNELIAKSVPIRPDQHIEKVTLLKDLNTGLYDATAYVNYFNLDTQAYISKAAFKIKVTVQ